jgi:dTDP-4-dehydrorhamnose 3,5-epimerase
VQRQVLGDARGFLARLFCAEELAPLGWYGPIAQINHTYTERQGTVRGMHYQNPPHSEMKLVTCLRGQVWDVAVDLRIDSPTYLQWHAQLLSAENHCSYLIPAGFAHGFQALTNGVELLYCHSMPYTPSADAGVHALDPHLAIAWPQPITCMSERDRSHRQIDTTFKGVQL